MLYKTKYNIVNQQEEKLIMMYWHSITMKINFLNKYLWSIFREGWFLVRLQKHFPDHPANKNKWRYYAQSAMVFQ